jgi:hypothetical protein
MYFVPFIKVSLFISFPPAKRGVGPLFNRIILPDRLNVNTFLLIFDKFVLSDRKRAGRFLALLPLLSTPLLPLSHVAQQSFASLPVYSSSHKDGDYSLKRIKTYIMENAAHIAENVLLVA